MQKTLLTALFFLLVFSAKVNAIDLYVSACGNDANDGTAADNLHAFKTIEGALQRIRNQGIGITHYSHLNTANYLVQDQIYEATQAINIILVNDDPNCSNEIFVNDRINYNSWHGQDFWGLTWNVTGTAAFPITILPKDATKPVAIKRNTNIDSNFGNSSDTNSDNYKKRNPQLVFYRSANITLQGITFEDALFGLVINSCKDFTIEDCIFESGTVTDFSTDPSTGSFMISIQDFPYCAYSYLSSANTYDFCITHTSDISLTPSGATEIFYLKDDATSKPTVNSSAGCTSTIAFPAGYFNRCENDIPPTENLIVKNNLLVANGINSIRGYYVNEDATDAFWSNGFTNNTTNYTKYDIWEPISQTYITIDLNNPSAAPGMLYSDNPTADLYVTGTNHTTLIENTDLPPGYSTTDHDLRLICTFSQGIYFRESKNCIVENNFIVQPPYCGVAFGHGNQDGNLVQNNVIANDLQGFYDKSPLRLNWENDGTCIDGVASPSTVINNQFDANYLSTKSYGTYAFPYTQQYAPNGNGSTDFFWYYGNSGLSSDQLPPSNNAGMQYHYEAANTIGGSQPNYGDKYLIDPYWLKDHINTADAITTVGDFDGDGFKNDFVVVKPQWGNASLETYFFIRKDQHDYNTANDPSSGLKSLGLDFTAYEIWHKTISLAAALPAAGSQINWGNQNITAADLDGDGIANEIAIAYKIAPSTQSNYIKIIDLGVNISGSPFSYVNNNYYMNLPTSGNSTTASYIKIVATNISNGNTPDDLFVLEDNDQNSFNAAQLYNNALPQSWANTFYGVPNPSNSVKYLAATQLGNFAYAGIDFATGTLTVQTGTISAQSGNNSAFNFSSTFNTIPSANIALPYTACGLPSMVNNTLMNLPLVAATGDFYFFSTNAFNTNPYANNYQLQSISNATYNADKFFTIAKPSSIFNSQQTSRVIGNFDVLTLPNYAPNSVNSNRIRIIGWQGVMNNSRDFINGLSDISYQDGVSFSRINDELGYAAMSYNFKYSNIHDFQNTLIPCDDCHIEPIDPNNHWYDRTKSIVVNPNPADNSIQASSVEHLLFKELVVFDMQGRALLSTTFEATTMPQLNVSSLAQGIYLLQTTDTDNMKQVVKFVKQ